MEILPARDFVISHIGYLEKMNPLNYADLLNADTIHCTNQKIVLANITMDLIRKVFLSIGKLLSSEGGCKFSKFYFSLENSNFIIGNQHCQVFSLKWQLHPVRFQENVFQIPKFDFVKSFLQVRMMFCDTKSHKCFSLRQSSYLNVYTSHFMTEY